MGATSLARHQCTCLIDIICDIFLQVYLCELSVIICMDYHEQFWLGGATYVGVLKFSSGQQTCSAYNSSERDKVLIQYKHVVLPV